VKQLLIDAGNTRLKWVIVKPGMAGTAGRARALPWTAGSAASVARRIMRSAPGAQRIVVCSVAGLPLERSLRQAARAAGLPVPLFIRSARRAAGVRNGYVDTWRLGADRWVGLIGARALLPGRALCIVDVGTALTVDLLDAEGRHRGGLLVPGPALMVAALLQSTAGIRRRAQSRTRSTATPIFARSTRAGLRSGSELAAAALIERVLREATALLGKRPKLLLAGGDAPQVARLLRVPHARIDDLVLRGLAMLAAGKSG
jgi:type III pantothenate kinase